MPSNVRDPKIRSFCPVSVTQAGITRPYLVKQSRNLISLIKEYKRISLHSKDTISPFEEIRRILKDWWRILKDWWEMGGFRSGDFREKVGEFSDLLESMHSF